MKWYCSVDTSKRFVWVSNSNTAVLPAPQDRIIRECMRIQIRYFFGITDRPYRMTQKLGGAQFFAHHSGGQRCRTSYRDRGWRCNRWLQWMRLVIGRELKLICRCMIPWYGRRIGTVMPWGGSSVVFWGVYSSPKQNVQYGPVRHMARTNLEDP